MSRAATFDAEPRPKLVVRPRLETALDSALGRRLTILTAGPGSGKTTLLSQWVETGVSAAWHTATAGDASLGVFTRNLVEKLRLVVPGLSDDVMLAVAGARGPDTAGDVRAQADAIAAAVAQDLDGRLTRDVVLVVDDVHRVDARAAAFLDALCRQAPSRLHLVTASRNKLPFAVSRMKLAGEAAELTADDLAFTGEEIERVVADSLGSADDSIVAELLERTSGWPAAVVFSVQALARRGGAAGAEGDALSPSELFDYVFEEVVAGEPPDVVLGLRRAAELPWVTRELLQALGIGDVARLLDRAGTSAYFNRARDVPDAFSVSPLIRDFLISSYPLDESERRSLHTGAVAWYERTGALAEALSSARHLGLTDDVRLLLVGRGEGLLAAGLARQVAKLIEDLAAGSEDPELALLEAEARQITGDWEGAIRRYRVLAPGEGDIPARVAWRMGFLAHMRGDVDEALAIYHRGVLTGESPADEAALHAWTASAHWLRGERDRAKDLADRALELARDSGDSATLATAHTVLAMVAALDGDRAANDIHYLRALEHAERARDVIQTIRIRSNRGSHFLEEGDYDAALAELEIALRLADMTGFELWRAMSLSNRAQAVAARGHLDEAIVDLEQARTIFRKIGSRLEAYPVVHLGDVHAARGDVALARAAYEEGIRLAEGPADRQALVPALAGLARIVAEEDAEQALELAARATSVPSVLGYVRALVAEGWAARAAGAADRAMDLARAASSVARERHDLPGLAEALELEAALSDDDTAGPLLDQARRVWDQVGAPLDVARVDLAIATRSSSGAGTTLAAAAATAFERLGAKARAMEARRLADALAERTSHALAVKTLGGLSVFVAGEPVPAAAWQSKVARDLLGMLVANRGRPMHREVLIDRLWPDQDVAKSSNRLSVALSTIRGVLDPDRSFPQDHYLAADRESVGLRLENMDVDVEAFLDQVAQGRRLMREAHTDHALAVWRTAEARYVGEFLEEQPYAEWAVGLREEARAAFIDIASALAQADRAAGDHDAAARRYLRILERDRYHEPAHLGLVRAMSASGRHGTARRLYGIYVSRMAELEVEPEAFPT